MIANVRTLNFFCCHGLGFEIRGLIDVQIVFYACATVHGGLRLRIETPGGFGKSSM